jgi:uncharacterized protein YndB with AHSA1/START domain
MFISREFAGPLQHVWEAWTTSELLDLWWAPKPWKAKTKIMDFREGGRWLYCMLGPDGEQSWTKANFVKIHAPTYFEVVDAFCDEDGVEDQNMPKLYWKTAF